MDIDIYDVILVIGSFLWSHIFIYKSVIPYLKKRETRLNGQVMKIGKCQIHIQNVGVK